ncbi:MAG: hypothetical protein ACFLMY_07030 [Candidatus Brachytrichaceae bacterium NZ_4S206]|jgi:hypothetical protein
MYKRAPSLISAAVAIGVLTIAVAIILSLSWPGAPFGNTAV